MRPVKSKAMVIAALVSVLGWPSGTALGGQAVDQTVDLTAYYDWGAISSYPGLWLGSMGIYSARVTGAHFPSDATDPNPNTVCKAWLTPGVHLATDYGPANINIPANPPVMVPDRYGSPCSLYVRIPGANLIDEASDLNVIQLTPGESKVMSINDTVETMVFLACCDYGIDNQPVQVRLSYDGGTEDVIVVNSIHQAERLLPVCWPGALAYGNEVFGCGPAFFGQPWPESDWNHSLFWHWYALYPDPDKLLSTVTFEGIPSKDHSEIYVASLSYARVSAEEVGCEIRNGSFERRQVDTIPTNWEQINGCVGPPPFNCTHEAWTVDTAYLHRNHSLYMHSRVEEPGDYMVSRGCSTTAWTAEWINNAFADSIKFHIRDDRSSTHSTSWGWLNLIYVYFTDGLNNEQVLIYADGENLNLDSVDYTIVGADGHEWYAYVQAIPTAIDRTHMKIGICCYAGLWTDCGCFSDLKFFVDSVGLVLPWGKTIGKPLNLKDDFDWGAISTYAGLSPPGNKGIFSPTHSGYYYFPSDAAPSSASFATAWLIPGSHWSTDYGPGNSLLPSNPMVTARDRYCRPCSLFTLFWTPFLMDSAKDNNVIRLTGDEAMTIPIDDTVETMVFLASRNGWVDEPGGPDPDGPLEVRLHYSGGLTDTLVVDSIHPAERASNISSRWAFVFGNEAFGCGPPYYDLPNPSYDDLHSEFWHWYALYPDTSMSLDSVTFVAMWDTVYIPAISYSDSCCNHDGIRGDVDYDGQLNLVDITYLVRYLFIGGLTLPCPEEADVNCDLKVNLIDLVWIVDYLFGGGPTPCRCDCADCRASSGRSAVGDISLSAACEDGMTTVLIASSVDFRGIQIELSGDRAGTPVSLVDEDLELLSRQEEGHTLLGILDLEGRAVIAAGSRPLLRLPGKHEIREALISDMNHHPVIPVIEPVARSQTIPYTYALHQNYPNPFNPATTIAFEVPERCDYSLAIYNVVGQQVTEFTGTAEPGEIKVEWDASGYASGVYMYRLQAGAFTETKKMLLLK